MMLVDQEDDSMTDSVFNMLSSLYPNPNFSAASFKTTDYKLIKMIDKHQQQIECIISHTYSTSKLSILIVDDEKIYFANTNSIRENDKCIICITYQQ